jgi:N-acyl-D-amino-acid deacylase
MSATFDVLIEGGRIVDGSGSPAFESDIGIRGDRIAAVGPLSDAAAALKIDARGCVITPGFIDVHVHSETDLLRHPVHEASLRQGVTTHVLGQDGFGFAPVEPSTLGFMIDYLAPIYDRDVALEPAGIAEFLSRYDDASTVNVATLVPAGLIRMNVLGNTSGAASPAELEEMAALCRIGMEEGAVGLSSGLDYTPGGHASTAELVRLCQAVAPFGGVYVTHMRYRLGLMAAVAEAIEIGRRSGAPLHISHLVADLPDVHAADLLGAIGRAREAGLEVTFDMYPYLFGCTTLAYLLPLWMLEGSIEAILHRLGDPEHRARVRQEAGDSIQGWRQIAIAGQLPPARSALVGLDVLAAAGDQDPVDFLCDLLLAERLDVMLLGIASEDPRAEPELVEMLRSPWHLFGSDGIYRPGRAHPRGWGGFSRYLSWLLAVRALSLEEVVAHATAHSAQRFGLAQRGMVRPDYFADVVVLDPGAYRDVATLETPRAAAHGVRAVLDNGVPALCDGTPTGATPGRGLRRGRAS